MPPKKKSRAELLAELEVWNDLSKKYKTAKDDPGKVLYLCLANEEEAGDNNDAGQKKWIENIEICLNEMEDRNPNEDPVYKEVRMGYSNRFGKYAPRTILGTMMTWQKEHVLVENFLRKKLDFHKVINDELYMNAWAWGVIHVKYFNKARPVFLAVLYGKTRWLKELLQLGAKTDAGQFFRLSLRNHCIDKYVESWSEWGNDVGNSSFFSVLTPTQLNDYFLGEKKKVGKFLRKEYGKEEDIYLVERLKNVEGLEGDKLKEKVKKIRTEIKQLLLVGGADRAKIKDSGNPQGLKLKY